MSAPITEAHLELAKNALFSRDSAGRLLTAAMAARLIADSEAKEVALHRHIATQLAALLNAAGAPEFANAEHASQWAKEISGLRAERDQLRAEVERLKSDGAASASKRITLSCRASRAETERNNLRADLDAIKAILNEEKARAERAEASLHALRLVCGTTDADKFSTWVDRANARAERAEAELANIRALANRRNKQDHSHDTTHQLVASLDQSLDIVQAELAEARWLKGCAIKRSQELLSELAAERARLDWLVKSSDNPLAINLFPSYGWTEVKKNLRASIDAEMKEGTK